MPCSNLTIRHIPPIVDGRLVAPASGSGYSFWVTAPEVVRYAAHRRSYSGWQPRRRRRGAPSYVPQNEYPDPSRGLRHVD